MTLQNLNAKPEVILYLQYDGEKMMENYPKPGTVQNSLIHPVCISVLLITLPKCHKNSNCQRLLPGQGPDKILEMLKSQEVAILFKSFR